MIGMDNLTRPCGVSSMLWYRRQQLLTLHRRDSQSNRANEPSSDPHDRAGGSWQSSRRNRLAVAASRSTSDQIQFRDADQIASWVNSLPSVAAWALEQIQPGLVAPFGDWTHWAGRYDATLWIVDLSLPSRTAHWQHGLAGLESRRTAPKNPANRTAPKVVEKVLHLRTTYRLKPIRIVWYLARYHAITISDAGVYRILRRNGLSRLPSGTRVRKINTQRYQQQVPGHQIRVDGKFLKNEGKDGKPVKRYQYTAIDDATRVRALKIYDRHN